MQIADVTAHAMHVPALTFSLSLSLSLPDHQQVEELWAILVVVQANLAVLEVQEAPKVSGGSRGTSRSSKKVNLGGDGKLVSSPSLFCV